ncbi:MAG: sigma 54-interacting transcriptional regulator [Pyrinomonadaceae bacterium]
MPESEPAPTLRADFEGGFSGNKMHFSGYDNLREIGRGDWFTLHRGRRVSDRKSVLLKVTKDEGKSWRERMTREFELLLRLPVPGVADARQLLRTERKTCLVLEDKGGIIWRTLFPSFQTDFKAFLDAAVEMAGTLSELHRLGVTLNLITPDNILYDHETNGICLVDLGYAVQTTAEDPAIGGADLSLEVLRYISPEQTRRLNRTIDYRTDFYSLGAVFYELLAGRPPFRSGDPLELIHLHIAKNPTPPSELNPLIPEPLSEILLKLLAKPAEQRYQSALGLKADLEICRDQWSGTRRIKAFRAGEADVSDRFNIPQELYGRSAELEKLTGVFERASGGSSELLLVSGYSGIGKTSLIRELYRPVIAKKGYFINGKFDQVARGVPFGALIQAFRGLVRQLLTESEEKLLFRRTKLLEVLGGNGGVLAEVVPEIELVIGRQPVPPALGPTETLNRFQMVIQNFVGAIARAEHPLVIFLDDLQWSDPATLSLLGPLLTDPGVRHLLLIGAYRENEVDPAHPLTRTLNLLESAGVGIDRLTLGNLQLPDLKLFIGDALPKGEVGPLARLVLEKTGGNPFFVIQFLKTLEQENFIRFDFAKKRWVYRIDEIKRAAMTDNVVDLMVGKIRKLPEKAQKALTLASCIGNPFDGRTLAVIGGQNTVEAEADLQSAVAAGLILRFSGNYGSAEEKGTVKTSESGAYSFAHDRIQQAAHSLIPDREKGAVHLTVGRFLRDLMKEDEVEEKLFDVVNHLNLGRELMTDREELFELARLNLEAGRRAKSSSAFEAARGYLETGAGLLGDEHWETDYELAFELNLETAVCEYLCGNFDGAERMLEVLLPKARTNLDRARVLNLKMVQYENMARYAEALAVARETLALFRVSFPDAEREKQTALDREIESIRKLLGGRPIGSLIDLPRMTDPETRMIMNILTDIWSSTYITGDAVLARLISATMVRLSLERGNAEESAYGYVTHAITVGPVLEDYESAYEFGRLALEVNERFDDSRRRAKIHQQFHAHVNLWRRPLETGIRHAREACRSGLEAGDLLYASYGAMTETWAALFVARDLGRFIREYRPGLELIRKLKVSSFADAHRIMLNWAGALRGKTLSPTSLSTGDFDEREYVENYRDNPFFTMFQATAKMHLNYLFGDRQNAFNESRRARKLVGHLSGTIWTVLFDFWNGLILADHFDEAEESDRRKFLMELEEAERSLGVLAENCPENFLCQFLLLSAEIRRIGKNETSAPELYERAIDHAQETGSVQFSALANELYAGFWMERGLGKIAAAFLSEAVRFYQDWGAGAKVAHLRETFSDLLEGKPIPAENPLAGTDHLDIFSVTKAAQAITGEIELENLLTKLIGITMENAGAEKGCLILEKDGKPALFAEGALGRAPVHPERPVPLSEAEDLPLSVINYVRRTLKSVVLEEAAGDKTFGKDPYIIAHRPRSMMTVPIIGQGRLRGIIHLENKQVAGAFTSERAEVCQILASQAAISLENAALYNEMKQEAIQRKQAEETLRSIMQGTAALTGDNFFASLVSHLAAAFEARYAFLTECRGSEKTTARTLAFSVDGKLVENVSYDIAKTPCFRVLAGETCFYPQSIQRFFPEDADLVDMKAEGYWGIPMFDAGKKVIGHLAVLDDKPIEQTPQGSSLLGIFAARAGAELERLRAEEALQAALAEVESLKNRLHDENLYLQEEIRQQNNFDEIIGESRALLDALQNVERVAPTDATVLITGETGTGKELIARAVHDHSRRKNRPLVKVNCAAISAGLVESELFGHSKGAFTGAVEKRIGRFELADGGTIFLDEVGELPADTQVKLLRVLQEGEFEPVGSSKTVKTDVRVIAATNRDLEAEVRAGRFRSDLFYRLNVFPIRVPPLRERREDIPALVMFFLERYGKKLARQIESVPADVMNRLIGYDWLGNVRELQNVIERAVVLAHPEAKTLLSELIPIRSVGNLQPPEETALKETAFPAAAGLSSSAPLPPQSSMQDVERHHIISVLERTNWVIGGEKGAAQALDLHPNTLRSRLKKLGIKRPEG